MAKQWLDYLDSFQSETVSGTYQKIFNSPKDVAVDYNYIYVIDSGNHKLQIFENFSPYRFAASYSGNGSGPGGSGNGIGDLSSPEGIDIDDDYFYIADTGNNRIVIYDKHRLELRILFGSAGSTNSDFNSPKKIAVDDTYIYISDSGNNRLQIFQKNLILNYDNVDYDIITTITTSQILATYVTSITGLNSTRGIDIDTNYIYIADSKENNIGNNNIKIHFNKPTTYNYVSRFGSYGTALNKFNNLSGVYISGNNLYIVNSDNHRIDVYNKNTYNYLASLGSYGTGTSQFNTPNGLHIDETTNKIYVADTLNNRIQIFNNIGNRTSIITEPETILDIETEIILKQTEIYSDIDFKLRKIAGNNDVIKAPNETSINQSLYSLLSTSKGERVFNLNYGTNIKQYLFEPMDTFTARNILDEIKIAIATWEGKRVKIKELDLDINYDNSTYNILIEYDILNSQKSGTFELILQKI